MKTSDIIARRYVANALRSIEEHLESMQRDSHGLEFTPWKEEVDGIWKDIFENINSMSELPQRDALELIRESWTSYLTHYAELKS